MNVVELGQESLIMGEVQLLLAEKRTYYSLLRTGVAVFALPLTVFGILWATLSGSPFIENPLFTLPVGGVLIIVSLLGLLLVYDGWTKLRILNTKIRALKASDAIVDKLII